MQGYGGELVDAIEARFPGTVRDGAIDRDASPRACSATAMSSPRSS